MGSRNFQKLKDLSVTLQYNLLKYAIFYQGHQISMVVLELKWDLKHSDYVYFETVRPQVCNISGTQIFKNHSINFMDIFSFKRACQVMKY